MTSRETPATLLWAGLLIVVSLTHGSPAHSSALTGVDPERLSVQVEDGLLNVIAHDVPLRELIEVIAAEHEIMLVLHTDLERTISLDVERVSLSDLLTDMLRHDSYQLYLPATDTGTDEPIPGTLWIFAEGAAIAPAATVFLEAVLFEGTQTEKLEAIRELRRQGTTTAVQGLGLALVDEDRRVRDAAIEALERLGTDDAMAAIASAAMDSDPWIRSEAVNALSSGDGANSVAYLTMSLDDPDPRVRMSVLEALADVPMGTVPDQQAINALNQGLKDPHPDVRMQALESLEEIGGDVAFQALMQAKRDQDADVADAARDSLARRN